MGGVYIIQNPVFPEYIKVGRITSSKMADFNKRFATLNTAVPYKFVPLALYAFKNSDDAFNAEMGFHRTYKKYRVNNSEFFYSTVYEDALRFFSLVATRCLKSDAISRCAQPLNLTPTAGFPKEWIFQKRELFYRDNPKIRAVVRSKNEVQMVSNGQLQLPTSLSALTKQLKGGRGNYNGFLYWNDCKTGLPLR